MMTEGHRQQEPTPGLVERVNEENARSRLLRKAAADLNERIWQEMRTMEDHLRQIGWLNAEDNDDR